MVAILLLATVIAVETVVFGGRITANVKTLTQARAVDAPVTTPSALRPTGYVSSLGTVGKVELRSLTPCRPGTLCDVWLLVHVSTSPRPTPLLWDYVVRDACGSRLAVVPGGSQTVKSGQTTVGILGTLRLPARAADFFVVLHAPAIVGSAPVVVHDASSC